MKNKDPWDLCFPHNMGIRDFGDQIAEVEN